MWSLARSRAKVALLVALLASAALAGCFGDEEVPEPGSDEPDAGTGPTGGGGPIPTSGAGNGSSGPGGGIVVRDPDEQVPEAHYHHYWGDPPLPEVVVFEGAVTLDHTPCFDSEARQQPSCVPDGHIGSVTFNLESDGDQVNADSREPHLDGHADTVFTGTSTIVATLIWEDALLGDSLRFYYKPANSPMFLPRKEEPAILVTLDDPTVEIPLAPGMADPAHQFWVSRWEFMLVANGGPQPDWQFPIKLAQGEVNIEMVAKNGGKQSIDPAHPDQWAGKDLLSFGTVTGDFEIASVRVANEDPEVDQRVAQGDGFEDIQMPMRAVVPAGAEKLVVRAWVNATDEASANLDWGLKYHGADRLVYKRLVDYTEDNGARVYEISVAEAEVDPPYETQSYFRFGFFPIGADQDEVGFYAAQYALAFEAHKDPTFTYNF